MTTIRIEHNLKIRYFVYQPQIIEKHKKGTQTFTSTSDYNKWCNKAKVAMENHKSTFIIVYLAGDSYCKREDIKLHSKMGSIPKDLEVVEAGLFLPTGLAGDNK